MAISGSARLTLRRTEPGKTARKTAPAGAPVQARLPGPIVKWAGGKTRLLDELVGRAPRSYRRYFEPFAGGAALFFRLAPRAAVLSDLNQDLINAYRCVAWNVEAVIRRLAKHRDAHDEAHYYAQRERWNTPAGFAADVDRAAAFIYLNKTCYNGLWRVNSKGGFNVPMGRYDDPPICDGAHLRLAAKVLQRAELASRSYHETAELAEAGDLVYFDPPYQPVSDTAKFVSYTAEAFGEDDQAELARVVKALVRRGVHVMVSNSDTKLIRELYKGLRIDSVLCARAINSRADARGPAREVIVCG